MSYRPNIAAIFADALERQSPVERAAFLDKACAENSTLRAEVDALLALEPNISRDFLGNADAVNSATTPAGNAHSSGRSDRSSRRDAPISTDPLEQIGSRIGPYKLLQKIGEGGMGTVYLAEQHEPIRRKVALKIVKAGMDTAQVLARFEAERQALALMDHPHIAKVYDAGTTATGRPYFIMEMVNGVPITKYCDELNLSLRERLELFALVCRAIQHAHQKGVIHRDIKPSNVLVAITDGKPVPKVIDFGIAKAINQKLTEETLFTAHGAVVGTPEYMSPEQADLSALGVDVRSDVYSLGVLLYELLTGTTPLDRTKIRAAALFEVLRCIREIEPVKPSTRVAETHGSDAAIARSRKTEPGRLERLIKGELDWIAMRALEKDRSRRYDSASGLARDVERYLNDEPVEACPPSNWYRLNKIARRNKGVFAAAGAIVAALAVGLGIATWNYFNAVAAEAVATQKTKEEKVARVRAEIAEVKAEQKTKEEVTAKAETQVQLKKTEEALTESRHQEGTFWVECAQKKALEHDAFAAAMMAAKAVGFNDYGRSKDKVAFDTNAFPELRYPSGIHSEAIGLADRSFGTPIWQSAVQERKILSASFSPDGTKLVSVTLDKVQFWDVASGKLDVAASEKLKNALGQLKPANNFFLLTLGSVCFSPDGTTLVTGLSDGTVGLWDTTTWKEIALLNGHANEVTSLCFSPDGRRLATGSSDKTVVLWDVEKKKQTAILKGHKGSISSVSFSPDGATLASGSLDETIRLWDVASGDEKSILKEHIHHVTCVSFSPDGAMLASASLDETVRLWDVATGKVLFKLDSFASTHSVDADRLSDWTIMENLRTKHQMFGSGVFNVCFSPDGSMVASGSMDRTVQLWTVENGQPLAKLQGHTGDVLSVSFSPDGATLVSGGADKTLRLWDVRTARQMCQIRAKGGHVRRVTYSPNGAVIAVMHDDGTVRIWETATMKQMATLDTRCWDLSVVFSPDGATLATGDQWDNVRLWDVATGKQKNTFKGHLRTVFCVSFSNDGTMLAAGAGETVTVWDIASGNEKFEFKNFTDLVRSVCFSPDGTILAAGSQDKSVRVWEIATRTEKAKFDLSGGATRVRFSPDGRQVAAQDLGNSVQVWDVAARKLIGTFHTYDAELPVWARASNDPSEGTSTYGAIHFERSGHGVELYDTSLKIDYASYLPFYEIQRDGLIALRHPEGMPYLNVNPYSHIGILQSGKPQGEISRLLYWRYYQAMNKNSARLLLSRIPAGRDRDEAMTAFHQRFGGNAE